MAVAIMFSGIAAVALPLATEFGITREIEDRVMCPLPVAAVAIEKVCFSALQSIIAAAVVFPLAFYVPSTPVAVQVSSWPLLITVLMLLAGLTAGALGLAIGTVGRTPSDRPDLLDRRRPHHLPRLRLLSLGGALQNSLAADSRPAQSRSSI